MTNPPRILIACIGNIFLGDDAFGVHVARQLAKHTFPDHVRVVDFGIRGIDLTYALLDSCDVAILVDAVSRGQPPGTLSVIEPELIDGQDGLFPDLLEAHSMNPWKVFRVVRAMGGKVRRVLLIGCEPTPLNVDSDTDICGELSQPVLNAVEPATDLIQGLIVRLSIDPSTKEDCHESVPAHA